MFFLAVNLITVHAGSVKLDDLGIVFNVTYIEPYPGYVLGETNDLALVQINDTVEKFSQLKAIDLGTQHVGSYVTGTIYGFGATEPGGSPSNSLKQANIKTISNSLCNSLYFLDNMTIESTDLCGGLTSGACNVSPSSQ